MMPIQRACSAESQVRNKLSNGPLRAQSNVSFTEYSATLQADVICRGYVGILLSARVIPWIKVAPRIVFVLFVLDREYISVRDVFVLLLWQRLIFTVVFRKWRYRAAGIPSQFVNPSLNCLWEISTTRYLKSTLKIIARKSKKFLRRYRLWQFHLESIMTPIGKQMHRNFIKQFGDMPRVNWKRRYKPWSKKLS